jgi:Carboxypeptidase regulatory-like domain
MRLVKISIIVLVFSLVVIGQTNRGGITGTVTDSNGAIVPGAKVTITNVGTNQSTTVTASNSGGFSVSSLDPVLYNVLVEAPNFKKAFIENVKVNTATVATVNVVIEPGSFDESVTIQADAQMVNADSGTLSQTITERQLRDLPLNNRSVLDLAVTMPNVSGDAGSEDIDAGFSNPSPGFNLSVNGGRPGSTSMLADGVNNTGVGIARAVVSFSPETVQEFSVQSSAYSAEFGTTGGGVINITTKSGAKDIFGTALWYHRNPQTNARTWTQGTAPRPANNLRSNQASFTVGGPIMFPNFGDDGPAIYDGRKRGSFFFFALEPRWRNDFSQSLGLVPSAAERTGNFRGLVLTGSGWLPTSVATRFNLPSIGADNNVYQQFTVGAGGSLVPIIVPAGTGNQYCPFGWTPTIGGVTQVSFNAQNQPYCTSTQATAQIANVGNNPALNIIPTAFLDPIGVKLMGFLNPPGEYFIDNGVVRNFFNLRQATQVERRYTLRLDHNFTDRTKATFRYTKTPAVGIRATSGSDINGNTGVYSDAQQYLVTLNKIISSSMTNEVRFNYTKGNFSEDFSPEFSIMGGRNFANELGIKSLTNGGLPVFGFSAADGTQTQYASNDIGSSISTNNFNVEKRYDLSDTFYYTQGNMLWKIGGNLSRAQLQVTPFFSASGGRWQFRRIQTNRSPAGTNDNASGGNSLASLLIGVAQQADARPAINTYNYQWDSAAFFVQNDWKVKPNFTLNLGLRYSLQLPRTEANNLQGVFRPDLATSQALTDAQRRAIATSAGVLATDPIPSYVPTSTKIVPFAFSGRGGRSKSLIATDLKAYEPRLGFAWSPRIKVFGFDTEKRNLVIRGGFGISHFPINGNNRGANPDFATFISSTAQRPATVGAAASNNTPNLAQPVRLTGNNPLQGTTLPLDTLLGTDANGLVYLNSLGIGAVAVDVNDSDYGKVPSSQSWNLAVQFAPFRNSTIEIAYAANRGINLYTPQININQRNADTISLLTSNNVNPAGGAVDPLGRVGLTGSPIGISIASLFSDYVGFEPLNKYYNAKSSSIRHAGYIDFRRRIGRGLSLTANYTFSKSLDDSSDSSPDVRVLTSGSVRGQVSLGGTLDNDYALSAFDTKHAFSTTFTWDLPFGKGRQFFKNAPWYVNIPFGGWIMSGVGRIVSGNPYQPFITDANFLGGTTYNRVIRPDIVPGVPLKNPLWDPKCRVGTSGNASGGGCEPYVNPAAFTRPAKGKLGNAPRTIELREPTRNYFDLSIQKDFPMPWIGGEGKRRINLRIDAINVLNKPNFYLNSRGNTPFGIYNAYPSELPGTECIANLSIPTPVTTAGGNCAGTNTTRSSPLSAAEYDAWANVNGQMPSSTAAGATTLGQIRAMIAAFRLAPRPGQTSGALPDNFFSIRLPQGFATSNALTYDIRTVQGFQLYRLRQQYNGEFGTLSGGTTGTSFGSPNPGTNQRYLQFGIRLIF